LNRFKYPIIKPFSQNSLFSSILVTLYSTRSKLDPQLTVERMKTIIDASIAEYKAKDNPIVFNDNYELQSKVSCFDFHFKN